MKPETEEMRTARLDRMSHDKWQERDVLRHLETGILSVDIFSVDEVNLRKLTRKMLAARKISKVHGSYRKIVYVKFKGQE